MEARLREDNAIETSRSQLAGVTTMDRLHHYGQVSALYKLYRKNNIRIMYNDVRTSLLSLNSNVSYYWTHPSHHSFFPIPASATSSQLNAAETSQVSSSIPSLGIEESTLGPPSSLSSGQSHLQFLATVYMQKFASGISYPVGIKSPEI